MPLEIAQKLDLNLKKAKKVLFNGIGGNIIEGLVSEVFVEIGGTEILTNVVFADISNGIFGQYDFFKRFQVKFDLKNKEIELRLN